MLDTVTAVYEVFKRYVSASDLRDAAEDVLNVLIDHDFRQIKNGLYQAKDAIDNGDTSTASHIIEVLTYKVENLHKEIHDLIEKHNRGKKYYSFQSNLPELKEQYKAKQEHDFGANILEAAGKRKTAARNSAAKKTTKR